MIHQAAILHIPTKTVYTLPRPARHHDVIRDMCQNHGFKHVGSDCEQGFTTVGNYKDTDVPLPAFVRRKSAKMIAVLADQILPGTHDYGSELFSENVW